MSDTSTTSSTGTATADPNAPATGDQGAPATGDDTTDWKAEAEKWKQQSRKHEDRAKANATAAKELEDLKAKSMTDQEKAVNEAKEAGKAEARAETAAVLVKAEIRAVAGGRFEAEQLATIVDAINPAAFLTDDGEVDEAKVQKYVAGIAPAQTDTDPDPLTQQFPDLGQGARGSGGKPNAALNGDPLLRDLKSKLGIR